MRSVILMAARWILRMLLSAHNCAAAVPVCVPAANTSSPLTYVVAERHPKRFIWPLSVVLATSYSDQHFAVRNPYSNITMSQNLTWRTGAPTQLVSFEHHICEPSNVLAIFCRPHSKFAKLFYVQKCFDSGFEYSPRMLVERWMGIRMGRPRTSLEVHC